jgi:phosphoribosylformylglycinamidine (FGAM) synthase-like amidotransferase family enzyme
MLAAFTAAGFEAWDVAVNDLLSGNVSLEIFRGIVFVGGFLYADVLDSGKGRAGVIKFNDDIFQQFEAFRKRKDTFSLGVCNGCQLMALLGWVPSGDGGLQEEKQPRFIENESGRFESRFSSVTIQKSLALMFKVRWHMERVVCTFLKKKCITMWWQMALLLFATGMIQMKLPKSTPLIPMEVPMVWQHCVQKMDVIWQ